MPLLDWIRGKGKEVGLISLNMKVFCANRPIGHCWFSSKQNKNKTKQVWGVYTCIKLYTVRGTKYWTFRTSYVYHMVVADSLQRPKKKYCQNWSTECIFKRHYLNGISLLYVKSKLKISLTREIQNIQISNLSKIRKNTKTVHRQICFASTGHL